VAEESSPAPEPEKPAVPRRVRPLDLALTLAVLILGFFALGLLQASTKELVDHDSLYHVRAANLLPEDGSDFIMKRIFPWMHATFLEQHYADKEFLFHVVLMPFCGDEKSMDAGGKTATILLGTVILAAFAFVLVRMAVRAPWLWLLLLLASGDHFLFRLCETRPHLLSITLMLLGVVAVLERRWLALYCLGYLYSWSYSGPEILPFLALLAAIGRWSRDGTISAAPTVAATVGMLSGLVLNPFTPNSLYLFRVQNIDVLTHAWFTPGIARLGSELSPVTTRSVLMSSPGLTLAFVVGFGAMLLARKKPSVRTTQLAFMTLGALGLFFASAKFIEYAAPLVVLFCASAVDDQWKAEWTPTKLVLACAFALLTTTLVFTGFVKARGHLMELKPPALSGAASWIARRGERGTVVAHFDWDDFSTLFHDNPHNYYLFGLDPTFAEVWDPEGLQYLQDIRDEKKGLDPAYIFDHFHARYLVVPKYRRSEWTAALTAGLDVKYGDDPTDAAYVFEIPYR
jgi:hypothetical protein